MPSFDLISMEEAMVKSATGKRAEIAREYLGYIEQLRSGWAGKLRTSEGESVTAIRRRLTSAAKFAGRDIVSKRVGDEVFFWLKPAASATGRRRGRPPKNAM